jgi:para-nitrobenzyl esterase
MPRLRSSSRAAHVRSSCTTLVHVCTILAIGACTEGPRAAPRFAPHGDAAPDLVQDAGGTERPDARADVPLPEGAVPEAPAEDTAVPDPLTVRVHSGVLQGVLDERTRTFRGIPFAKPPVGALRFARPQPEEPWEGVRDARSFGRACIQPVQDLPGPFSEDCLTLNVFAPLGAERAPVMVFLYGGGVMGGGMAYPARWLSEPTGVIVVTLNYRTGPLGFLQHPALDAALGAPSGNMGFLDQQRALAWVRENIAAFGGDSDNVTLFGESFGAMGACMHMFAHGSEALVQRFIMQSGTCARAHMPLHSRRDSAALSQAFVDGVCGGAADVVACLRALPAERFVPSVALELVSWRPFVDGATFEAPVQELLSRGAVTRAPAMVGTTRRELAMGQVPSAHSTLDFVALTTLFNPDHALALVEHYAPRSDAEAGEAFVRLQTDVMFRCPAQLFARDLAASGRTAYLFRFDVPPAVHAQDLDYIFGWPENGVSERYPEQAPIPPWQGTITAMQGYWTRFARSGDPNADDWPRWRAIGDEQPTRLLIGEHPLMDPAPVDDPDCAFLLAEGVL